MVETEYKTLVEADIERIKEHYADNTLYDTVTFERESFDSVQMPEFEKNVNRNIKYIVLINPKSSIDGKHSIAQTKIFGKAIYEWITFATMGGKCQFINYDENDTIVNIVKPYLGEEEITIVLYGDTPLIRATVLQSIVEDFKCKGQKVRKLKRGYLFDTEFLKTADSVYAPSINEEPDEDFFAVGNAIDFETCVKVLKERILSYHKRNGVIFIDSQSVYIDAEVDIASGVTIYPYTHIYGNSIIESGAIIEPNCIIKNSYIGKNAVVKCSYLENVRIADNAIIEPFTKVVMKKEK